MASRVNKVILRGNVEQRDLGTPFLRAPGDAVLVERGKPRLLILRCPCGCGDDLLINLDTRAGAAWYLYRKRKKLSLYPSYWRNDGCGSHFIIWNDTIYWCHGWESDDVDEWGVAAEIEDRVYAALPDDWFIRYQEVAEQLDLIPWEVIQACRQLVRKGKAVADEAPRRGMYRRVRSE